MGIVRCACHTFGKMLLKDDIQSAPGPLYRGRRALQKIVGNRLAFPMQDCRYQLIYEENAVVKEHFIFIAHPASGPQYHLIV